MFSPLGRLTHDQLGRQRDRLVLINALWVVHEFDKHLQRLQSEMLPANGRAADRRRDLAEKGRIVEADDADILRHAQIAIPAIFQYTEG